MERNKGMLYSVKMGSDAGSPLKPDGQVKEAQDRTLASCGGRLVRVSQTPFLSLSCPLSK